MILRFEVRGSTVLYGISNSGLSVASRASNFVFTPIEELNSFKRFTHDQKRALKETNVILEGLESDDAKRDYIIREMNKLDGYFVGELDVEKYLELYGENGFS